MFGEGISKEGEIVDYGVKLDIIDKSGAWFSYESTKLGQGRENAKAFLKENLNVADEITNKIRENMGDSIMSSGSDDENESEEE